MKENLNDLRTFLLVAELGSFTKAAAQLGVSQSAISYTLRGLEERLKIKLLERTTRSVSTTPLGEQFRQQIVPLFVELDEKVADLGNFTENLSGMLKITGNQHSINYTLREKFVRFMQQYPEIQLELSVNDRFTDIVAERFDAGIRLGSDVQKDMIAQRISPDVEMVAVASPDYWTTHRKPKTPFDLTEHNCFALRLATHGNLLAWEFINPTNQKTVRIQPEGKLISSNQMLLNAALAGLGVIWLPKDMVEKELQTGQLETALDDWQMKYEGYYLYYPSRRGDSPLFQALVKVLRDQ